MYSFYTKCLSVHLNGKSWIWSKAADPQILWMNKLLFCRLKKIKNKNVHLNQKFKYMYLHIKILGPGEINICCDTMLHRNNGSIFIEYLYLCMYSLRISIYLILLWEVGLKRCRGDKDLRCCCNHPFYVVIAVRMPETLHTKKRQKIIWHKPPYTTTLIQWHYILGMFGKRLCGIQTATLNCWIVWGYASFRSSVHAECFHLTMDCR